MPPEPQPSQRLASRGPITGARPVQSSLSAIPPVLRPVVRAYAFGYASAVGPRLLTLVLQHFSRRKRRRLSQGKDQDTLTFRQQALHIIRTGFDVQRFPTFCAVLAGGTTLLLGPIAKIIDRLAGSLSGTARLRLVRWISTFISAWLGMRLLQTKHSPAFTEAGPPGEDGRQTKVVLGGRTIDLTLFTATRALDVIVGELWSRHGNRRRAAGKWSKLEQLATNMVDPAVFVVSCAFIMWSWFYFPSNLPRNYNKWIMSAASVDLRLIEALRSCKRDQLRYGEDTGASPILTSMCVDYKWPKAWGDPAKTIPFPCDIVHMGCSSSCEYHAASRFVRSWKWAMYTYLPLALAFKLRKPTPKNLVLAFISASRSSAFLGVYITLFYYGVCLARTRVGPHIVGKDVQSRQRIDGGLCVGTGCVLCGWSVLIETASRRKDMALFVAPRALGTLFPRRYPHELQWRETLVFATSAGVVMTCVLENPARVRGVLGRLLKTTMQT